MLRPTLRQQKSQPKPVGKYVVVLAAIAVVAGSVYGIARADLFGSAPDISLRRNWDQNPVKPQEAVSVGKKFNFTLVTQGSLCGFEVLLSQGAVSKKLLERKFEGGSAAEIDLSKEGIELNSLGFQEGAATLNVEAKACSFFGGKAKLEFPVTVDFQPPRVQLTSSQHYVNQGGADLATYTVSEDTVASGVRLANHSFKGYAKPGGAPNERFAFFVFSYELPADTRMTVFAVDAAGNESTSSFSPARFFPKEFRRRELPIDDAFIETKVADIIANTPNLKNTGDNLQNFILVNRELRKKNAADLVEMSRKSEEKFFWKDSFSPLLNAAVEANFADYRSYMYNGQKVDEQVHLGFDLAIVERAPVTAGNRGKVMFAGYLGIYGNTVILDHGYGLITLYGHLSGMDVATGEMVTKGQKIGNSGVTGLAGGDHLHFSMLIQGVQTNPVEFWDSHWIQDHVYLRVKPEFFGVE